MKVWTKFRTLFSCMRCAHFVQCENWQRKIVWINCTDWTFQQEIELPNIEIHINRRSLFHLLLLFRCFHDNLIYWWLLVLTLIHIELNRSKIRNWAHSNSSFDSTCTNSTNLCVESTVTVDVCGFLHWHRCTAERYCSCHQNWQMTERWWFVVVKIQAT